MSDISKTIAPKSDQLNADDLIGGARTITVTRVHVVEGKSDEQPVDIFFEGDNGKPYKPCKSMRRVLAQCWGNDSKQYTGRSMTIYREPTVKFGGMEVGGIRISHLSHIEKDVTMALTAAKASRKPYTVKVLKNAPAAKQQQQAAQTAPAAMSSETKAAAEKASGEGVAAYTAWLATLSPEVKETVRPHHSTFTAAAKAADEKKKAAEEEIPFGDDEDETPAM